MFCKTYSVLVVAVCITCLTIFSKIDREQHTVIFRYQYSFRNDTSTYVVVERTTSPSQQHTLRLSGDTLSSENIRKKAEEDGMENNNMGKEMTGSQTGSILSNKQSQHEHGDVADGSFFGSFNIKELNDHLKKCIRENDHEVDMDEYIRTFQQLYKQVLVYSVIKNSLREIF